MDVTPYPELAQSTIMSVEKRIYLQLFHGSFQLAISVFTSISILLFFATTLAGSTSGKSSGSISAGYILTSTESLDLVNLEAPLKPMVSIPNVTVRFANPQYDCVAEKYCVDVEFQADTLDQQIFGMNVRLFYDDAILEFDTFTNFQGGYGPVAPDPATVLQSPPGFGTNYFGFPSPGVADWVNGAIQLIDYGQPPIYIDTLGWTNIFQICFDVDAPFADSTNFCPSIVWDLEQNPANGGFLSGDDGVIMTLVDGSGSTAAAEHVVQYNWEYTGTGFAQPYGQPAETDCFAFADATIDASSEQGCYFTNRVFQPLQSELPNVIYSWDFGVGAVPATATGYGPHTVYYDTSGTKTVTLEINPDPPTAQCPDSASITFLIYNCPAQIAGNVKAISNAPIPGVNLRLYTDADTNGIADNNIAVRSVFTTSIGNYSMASIIPGNYVIVQVQPTGWYSADDGDITDDGDIVANMDSLDNIIPVSLLPSELDIVNYFMESPLPGHIYGSVFVDYDNDQFPDVGEGIANVSVLLFPDIDGNGIADSNIPVSTQFTLADGSYGFENIPTGHYVICESQPSGYYSLKDIDTSNDNDVVPNTNVYNDTIPVTLINAENDVHNYFIDTDSCNLVVTNLNDIGPGTLRHAIDCASAGDTIRFNSSLYGSTITITSQRLVIDKNLVIYSNSDPRVVLASQIEGFFDIGAGQEVEFTHLDIISGLAGNGGAAFKNEGILKLQDTRVRRNPLLIAGEYLIYDFPFSQLFLSGSCSIDSD